MIPFKKNISVWRSSISTFQKITSSLDYPPKNQYRAVFTLFITCLEAEIYDLITEFVLTIEDKTVSFVFSYL